MATIKQLKEEIQTTESIKLITQALGDIATARIRRSRLSVERNIQFFDEVMQVYSVVRMIASKSKIYQKIAAAKNGKTVCILLTSNQRFFGGLDLEVTKFFSLDSAKYNTDRIVIGTAGQEMLKHSVFGGRVQEITFRRDFPTFEEMKALSSQIFSYSRILVYHSKFVTLLNQVAVVSDISETEAHKTVATNQLRYILEPEIEKMVAFFENQIMVLLFQAIFLDADIARTAARMVAMNQAGEQADKTFTQESKLLVRLRRDLLDRRILETYAGMERR